MILGVLQAWQFIDIFDWARTEHGAEALGRLTASAVIVLIAMAIWIAATSWIEYRLNASNGFVNRPRARTLLTLFRNAFTIAITVIAVMLALSELGVDIAPLIAGAGVLGLAIGFGSQKLV
jgi:small conductance mechanosensitive channel